jgi:DNA-binding response OmpR family regulator
MRHKVLIVDDDPELGGLIEAVLRPVEPTIYQAYSGSDGLKMAYQIHPDLIILDIMMAGMNGFEVCTRLRELSSTPVLMLTGRSNEADMLHGFNVGADDFVRKPFRKDELEARVRALLRRSKERNSREASCIKAYSDPILNIDLISRTVKLLGKIVQLSPREYDVLACLVREQGKVVSHREIVREVWGELYSTAPAISSLYVCYLRKKLEDGQHDHQYIHTLWSRGYWFEPLTST